MIFHDQQYLDALREIQAKGVFKGDRTGTGTQSRFGMQMRFDLTKGFPLLTSKKLHTKSIFWELLWFLRGETNVKWLNDHGVTIWDEWADENGELGPVYGAQWRNWLGCIGEDDTIAVSITDQFAELIETLKTNPNDRRMVISAWNVADIPYMKLPPCHCLFQFWVENNNLSCKFYQRSCDMFLGIPFNLASYAALTHLVAHICGMGVGDLIWTGGDCHIYDNHKDQVAEQLSRPLIESPTMKIRADAPKDIDGDWHIDHFWLDGYESHPGIKAPIAV